MIEESLSTLPSKKDQLDFASLMLLILDTIEEKKNEREKKGEK